MGKSIFAVLYSKLKIPQKHYEKSILYFKLSRVCSLRCVFFQFSSKKIYWLRDICYYLCNWNFTLWKGLKFVMRHYFDMWTCEQFSLLAVRKMFCHFQRPINGFIAVDLFFCFFVYSICGEALFHDDIKSDDEYFMANCSDCGEWYHKKCINIQVKVLRLEIPHAMEMLSLQKISYINLGLKQFLFVASLPGCPEIFSSFINF